MTTVKNIYDFINSIAPFDTQEKWDNAGLLVGENKKEVKTCLVSLDVTSEVFAFAKTKQIDLIVSHHPVIFSPLTTLLSQSLPYQVAQSGIAVISAHTNYDRATDGISDSLANAINLKNIVSAAEDAIRVGELPSSMNVTDFVTMVKKMLGVAAIRYSNSNNSIRKVAVCGGAGSDYIDTAMAMADAFVTGDASYHTLLDANEKGFCLVSAGHYETEIMGMKALQSKLSKLFTDVTFLTSVQKNPIKTI